MGCGGVVVIAQVAAETWMDWESMGAYLAIIFVSCVMAVGGMRRRWYGMALIGRAGMALMVAVTLDDTGPLAEVMAR